MHQSPLPKNPDAWPDNPEQLLNLPPGYTSLDLRRTYHRLLQLYRPDQFPVEFQKLHTAYQILRQRSEPSGAMDSWHELQLSPAPQTRSPEAHGHTTHVDDGMQLMHELWSVAEGGDVEFAFRGLHALYLEDPENAEVRIRLYWLQKLFPELKPQHDCLDWLVLPPPLTPQAAPLRTLYEQELLDTPNESGSERCSSLIHQSPHVSPLWPLLRQRWRSAARASQWDTIHQDLARLQDKVAFESPGLWLQMLLEAWEHYVLAETTDPYAPWEPDESQRVEKPFGTRSIEEMIAELGDVQTGFDDLLAEHDLLRILIKERVELAKDEDPAAQIQTLVNTVPGLWGQPIEIKRDMLLKCCRQLMRDPLRTLAELDALQFVCPFTLGYLNEQLRTLQRDLQAEYDSGFDQHASASDWLLDELLVYPRPYQSIRKELCLAAVRMGYLPHQIESAFEENYLQKTIPPWRLKSEPEYSTVYLDALSEIQNDHVLQLICNANAVLWC